MYRWQLWDGSWVFFFLNVIDWHMEQRKTPGTRNLALRQIWQQPSFIFDPTNCIECTWEAGRLGVRLNPETVQSGKSLMWRPESQEIDTYCSWVSILQKFVKA